MGCRQEQEVFETEARQEHKAALAAAAVAARDAKQDLQQMQAAAQRMAWRTRRWQISHLRRDAMEVTDIASQPVSGLCMQGYELFGQCLSSSFSCFNVLIDHQSM